MVAWKDDFSLHAAGMHRPAAEGLTSWATACWHVKVRKNLEWDWGRDNDPTGCFIKRCKMLSNFLFKSPSLQIPSLATSLGCFIQLQVDFRWNPTYPDRLWTPAIIYIYIHNRLFKLFFIPQIDGRSPAPVDLEILFLLYLMFSYISTTGSGVCHQEYVGQLEWHMFEK